MCVGTSFSSIAHEWACKHAQLLGLVLGSQLLPHTHPKVTISYFSVILVISLEIRIFFSTPVDSDF